MLGIFQPTVDNNTYIFDSAKSWSRYDPLSCQVDSIAWLSDLSPLAAQLQNIHVCYP